MADNKKKVKETILKDLFSSDEKLVIRAIDRTKKHADESFIEPLLLVYKGGSQAVRNKVDEILCALKTSAAEEPLALALGDERFDEMHEDILRFLWSSGFEPVGHLPLITNRMISGDYMTAVEGMTLIEQISGHIDDDLLMESMMDLRLALNDLDKENEKYLLLKTVHDHLDHIEKSQ
ncbi:MAG: hypothetical protein ACPGWM_04250 [Flavobacteriales bacterium]